MHSALTRVQAVFNYFTTVAVVIASLASLSVLLHPADDATTSVELANVQVYALLNRPTSNKPCPLTHD